MMSLYKGKLGGWGEEVKSVDLFPLEALHLEVPIQLLMAQSVCDGIRERGLFLQ